MDLNQEQIKKLSKWLIGMVSVCILIYLGVQNIHVVANTLSWIVDLIWPLILGLFFALILNVPLSFFETRIWKKNGETHPAKAAQAGFVFDFSGCNFSSYRRSRVAGYTGTCQCNHDDFAKRNGTNS